MGKRENQRKTEMNIRALATDYDGTIAHHGFVEESTIAALQRLQLSGRKAILVTGRELPDLMKVFPRVTLFDEIVGENGALLYTPATQKRELLAPEPDTRFIDHLRERGVHPLSVGHGIVATQETYHGVVAEAIDEFELDLQIILNKGALMILNRGVDKASGLTAALRKMGIAAQEVAATGDAENDDVFFRMCGYSAAVANAIPSLKETATIVTEASHGAGVEELIERILTNNLPVKAVGDRHTIGRD